MNEMETWLIRASVTAGALISLITLLKLINPKQRIINRLEQTRKWILSPVQTSIKDLNDTNNTIHEELKHSVTNLSDKVLKLIICTESIPMEERVECGREYVDVR
jgi:archaellum component FlaC